MARIKVMDSIFFFMDYREYLRTWYQARQEKNPLFSLRSFAKKVGFRSHNFLKMVMRGERNLTSESIKKIVNGLKMPRRESDYFSTLVTFNQSTDVTERQRFYEKLLQLQEIAHQKTIPQDQYAYYSSWYNTAVRELVALPDFMEDPEWIASQLNPTITPRQADESLKLLIKLGLVRRDGHGRLRQTDKLLTTGPEVYSRMVSRYHLSVLDLAKYAIDRFPRTDRDISTLTLSISKDLLPILKRRIQLFREEIVKLVATDEKSEGVVQLNLQLFPITKLGSKEGLHA